MRRAALRKYRTLYGLGAAFVREPRAGPADETLARVGRLLRDAEIPFAVVGGFAVIEHGYERYTTDVDVLVYVRDLLRAMEVLRGAGFPGGRTPIGARLRDEATGVDVDVLGTAFDGDERALARAVRTRNPLPVIPVVHLILMKLEAGRLRDEADVVELLKAGASSAAVRRYLRRTWPELVPRFEPLVARARAERRPTPRGRPPTR